MNKLSFFEDLRDRCGVAAEGQLTDFLSRRADRLLLDDRIDLAALADQYGAPLEIAFLPLITKQVRRMEAYAAAAQARTGYAGAFLYAYATKANFSEEVVRTALAAGAHYETSAAADVVIAHHLWRAGTLSDEQYIFCNGSKEPAYIEAILNLRRAGCARVVPILDDLDELEALLACPEPLLLGVRERTPAAAVKPDHPGGERFGLTAAEIAVVARRLAGTPHQLVVYHAMVGSQIENLDFFIGRLSQSVAAYAELRRQLPSLRMFNFGGGVPTSAYSLEFAFDYVAFFERLMATVLDTCRALAVPAPDLIGEFGRYTVASHNVYLLEVGKVKPGQGAAPPWYLINGSLMVSLPDALIVDDQEFVVLPLSGWDDEVREVRLAGRRTCDSDDVFPRPSRPPLRLPAQGEGLILAVFGVGAYQQMISGKGGAHHCLSPEMRRLIIEEVDGQLVLREVPQQDIATLMRLLGYGGEVLEPTPLPRRQPVPAERVASSYQVGREPAYRMDSSRRLHRRCSFTRARVTGARPAERQAMSA